MKINNKIIPWLFLVGIATVLVILAKTTLFQPLLQFIHTDQVNNWQIMGCIVFSIAGLWLVFVLLNIISKFYTSKFEQVPGNSAGALSNHSSNHGGE